MPAGLAFQTLTVVDEPPEGWPRSHRQQPSGGRVDLSEPSPVALPKHGLALRVNQEIEVLAVRIRQLMLSWGGVLLTVSIQERTPTASDDLPSYKFNFITVDRPGPVPSLVLRTQLASRPRRGRASKGYVHKRIYLWATKV